MLALHTNYSRLLKATRIGQWRSLATVTKLVRCVALLVAERKAVIEV